MKKSFILAIVIIYVLNGFSQPVTDKMDWWKEAKFGMFIHWGVYSVPAGTYHGTRIDQIGEWIMNSAKIPVAEYQDYAKKFNPVKYDAEEWVTLAKRAGMKYLVITSKHHDGFALFDSKVSDWDVVDATPYKEDLLKPLAEACHKKGIKLGFYYSQAQDWNNPGGAAARRFATWGWKNPDSTKIDSFTKEHNGQWDTDQFGDFDKYLDEIAVPQVKEILSNYGQVDILWWDTPSNMNLERAEKFFPILRDHPDLITNNRLGGGVEGDTETPEQFVPATGFPGRNWETCMTMNDTWGYKSYDENWKSTETIIRTLIDVVSKGGNYLLNVGPTPEGLIPAASIERLNEVGSWMDTNGESIYGTTVSPFPYLSWGRCTQKGNKLYLHVFDWPENGRLFVPLLNKVNKAYLLADPSKSFQVKKLALSNILELNVPEPDLIASVIVLEIEGSSEVLPLPASGKPAKASSAQKDASVNNLFDGDPKNRWRPAEGDTAKWAEVDLGEETMIGSCSLVEPWHPWNNMGQTIEIQFKRGDQWLTAASFTTNGSGITQQMEPVTSRYFRLKIIESKDPILNEWMLFRANEIH
tara:strand:+ start:20759 stop:22504 length:1746 start_codon:yes stop_codon:yes gene_type:complete